MTGRQRRSYLSAYCIALVLCSATRYIGRMAQDSDASVPVGEFIRKHVIPVAMSVTEAANRLGVGRPALSNLLNGNSALSPDMAVRLEKSFGADRQLLLDRQAATDRAKQRET